MVLLNNLWVLYLISAHYSIWGDHWRRHLWGILGLLFLLFLFESFVERSYLHFSGLVVFLLKFIFVNKIFFLILVIPLLVLDFRFCKHVVVPWLKIIIVERENLWVVSLLRLREVRWENIWIVNCFLIYSISKLHDLVLVIKRLKLLLWLIHSLDPLLLLQNSLLSLWHGLGHVEFINVWSYTLLIWVKLTCNTILCHVLIYALHLSKCLDVCFTNVSNWFKVRE